MLVLVGVLYPLLSTLEGMVSAIPLPIVRYWLAHPNAVHINWEFAEKRLPWTMAIGVLAGLVAATLKARRGYARGSQWQLVGNLFWCGFYAHIPLFLNAVLVVFAHWQGWKLSLAGVMGAVFPALLNGCAIVWAIVRTIGNDDVLTPRVLMEKVRRSSRLVG